MRCRDPCRHQFCWLCLGPHYDYKGCYCNSFRRGSVDNTPETSTNIHEKARKKAKLYLERYIHYYERWENNGRSKGKALEDFDKVKTEHIKLLGVIQGNTKEHEYDFLIEAWQQIIECRQVLRWTYAYGYYMPEDAVSKTHLFEFLQGHAEFSLERLHNCAESELQPFLVSSSSSSSSSTIDNFKDFKTKLVGLTKVTGTYFKRLITALEEGLPETSRYGDGAAYEETKWTCDRCTFINEGSAVSCAVCSDENPQGYWSCNRCTLLNPLTSTRCTMCAEADADQGGEV